MFLFGLAALCITFLLPEVTSQTELPTEISGIEILTLGGSPYIAQDDVHILPNSTLHIEAGATLKFASGTSLFVDGRLEANGTATHKVTFTLFNDSDARTEFENSTNLPIRLQDGDRFDRGTLMIYNGQWLGICDTRLSDLDSYKTWADKIAKVACRELGFADNTDKHLVRIRQKPVSTFYRQRLDCTGQEGSITQCAMPCCYYCDTNEYIIGVVCESALPLNHWGSIVFTIKPQLSTLEFVIIELAGVASQHDSHNCVPALKSNNQAPFMNNVAVVQSAYDGIHLDNLTEKINLHNIQVSRNLRHGLHVTTYVQQMSVSSVEATENGDHGILIDRRIQTEFTGGSDFCDVTCVRCYHEPQEFPLKFYYYRQGSTNLDCEKSFTTTGENYILAIWIQSSSNNVHVSVRDGAYIDSPYIWQAEVMRSQWANSPPVLLTTSDTVTIRARSTSSSSTEHLNFSILSGTPESFGVKLSDITGRANGGSGLAVDGIQMPIYLSALSLHNNTDGLLLKDVSAVVKVTNLLSSNNTERGISLQNTDGWLNIYHSIMERNTNDGLYYYFARACSYQAVAQRFAINLHAEESQFNLNGQHGLQIYSLCRINISLNLVDVNSNNIGTKIVHNYRQSDVASVVTFKNNTYANNQKGIIIEGQSSLNATARGNNFLLNHGECLWFDAIYGYYFHRQLTYRISHNIFDSNAVSTSSVLSIVVTNNNNYQRNTSCEVTDNTFSKNNVTQKELYYVTAHQDTSSILFLSSQSNADAQRNVFLSNKAKLMLSAADNNLALNIDARYCYWGVNNINDIADTIWAHHQRGSLARASFFPYLRSADLNDYDLGDPEFPEFFQGNTIGGIVRENITVTNTPNTYTVKSDITILPEAVFTVERGVQFEFELGTSIIVFGKIVAEGSNEEPIAMYARQTQISPDIRLFNGSAGNSGFLQIQQNNHWYSMCASNLDTTTKTYFCHAVGYQGFKMYTSKYSTYLEREGLGFVICSGVTLDECQFSQPKIINCTSQSYVYLDCSENTWSGIHLAVEAKKSTLKSISLMHTGFYSYYQKGRTAIQVDLMHHQMSHINISQQIIGSDVAGIKILKIAQGLNNKLSNIAVSSHQYGGLVFYDSRFNITECAIRSDNNVGNGLHVLSSMVSLPTLRDEIIKSICFNTSAQIDEPDSLFLRVLDTEIPWNTKCELFLRAPESRQIAIQVISGNVGTANNCGERTLLFHDGHKDYSEPQGVQVNPDGHVWLSNTNEVHLIMHRVYSSHSQCMNIVLHVSVVQDGNTAKFGPTIEKTHISGFSNGIYLNILTTPVIIKGAKIDKSNNGIYIVPGDTYQAGLYTLYSRGVLNISDSAFNDNKQSGIRIKYGNFDNEDYAVRILKSNFSQNNIGFELDKSCCTTYIYTMLLQVSSSLFIKNVRDGYINIGKDQIPNGKTTFIFADNELFDSSEGIIYNGNSYLHRSKYAVENNLFERLSGQVLNLKGSGILAENIIRNCTVPRSLIEVFAAGNRIPLVANNTLINNKLTASCATAAALVVKGTQQVIVQGNILENNNFTYELVANLITTNSTTPADMRFNYWGTTMAENIVSRIRDGRLDKRRSVVSYTPFFTNDEKTATSSETFEPDIRKEGYRLSGRVANSVILSKDNEPYIIDDELIIPSGVSVTVQPGTGFQILPKVSIMVYGSLNLEGTIDQPVILTLSEKDLLVPCNSSWRLVNGNVPNEGRLEKKESGSWRPLCNQGWSIANAAVICRQMKFGPPTTTNRVFGYSGSPIQRVYHCQGDESSLSECPSDQLLQTCSRYNPVGVVCSNVPKRFKIQFLSGIEEPRSVLQNVLITDIERLEVTGVPPLLQNVTVSGTDKGILLMGSGVANEMDVIMNNVTVVKSENSGVSLYDITSNVTFNRVVIEDTKRHGIYQAPSYDDKTHTHASDLYSTFRFCDASPEHYVRPGEEYKFFKFEAQSLRGCRRLLRTDGRYSVHIIMKSYTTSYSSILVASIYEGEEVDSKLKSADFHTIRADRGSQTIQTHSQGNTMVVVIHLAESAVDYALVVAKPTRVSDCSFENGMCGWHNYADPLAEERGNWTLYSPKEGTHVDFRGLGADVTYPSGNEGHYIYSGSTSSGCDYFRSSAEEAVLESGQFLVEDNMCSVTFYHYRGIHSFYRGDALSLYGNTQNKSVRLWSETLLNRNNRWERATVYFDQIIGTDYSLLFHVKYMKGCPNSVGIDNVKFTECPREKLVSTIRVSDSLLRNIPGRSIFFWNNDPEKHNVIWLERVAIHDNQQTTDPAIGLKLKSAYVLIRNVDIYRVTSRAIDIEFSSVTTERISEVTLSQNSITYSRSGGAVFVTNIGTNDASVWLTKNIIQHSTGEDLGSVVQVVNCSLIMNSNLIHNNTGRYILELGSQTVRNDLLQDLKNNTFWFNSAKAASAEYTISLYATKVIMTSNIVNNPSNSFEISSQPMSGENTSLNCMQNWWGTGIGTVVDDKIRDGRTIQDLPEIEYTPFLENPPPHFGISASCPLGWRRSGSYCFYYNGGAVTFDQALSKCLLYGALVMTANAVDYEYVYEVTEYRDVDGSHKRATVWIKLESSGNQPGSTNCNVLLPKDVKGTAKIAQADSCIELHPFICQKTSIVLCKNACFQRGICMGETCLCDKGWDGEDCSMKHCRDVSNCTAHGECVGPNVCKCKPGWMGRACSTSYCARFDNCRSCSPKTGCGWCDSSHSCLPGTGQHPDVDTCDTWFYYTCLTMDSSTTCSSQISTIGCASRYCNQTTIDTDNGLCQQCRDIEGCYKTDLNNNCFTWNETLCPLGAVGQDFEDTTRVKNTIFKDDVHVVYPNEMTIYFCPSTLSSNENDDRNLFIAYKRLYMRKGDIIISPQSGGILHKVVYNTPKDGLNFLVAVPAGLMDAILYADFKQSFDIQDIDDKITREAFPDDDLLVDFISGDIEVDETVHVLQEDIPVYKCVGHSYDDGTATTSYLVIPVSKFAADVQVGDVIVSNKTRGFLEDIVSIKSTSMGTFAETKLTRCPLDGSKEANLKLNIPRRDMACKGGDNWPGLVYWESFTELANGQTVVGRRSGSVLDQVIYVTKTSDYLYLEVLPVKTVDNGTIISITNVTDLKPERRVQRATTSTGIFEQFSKSLQFELGGDSEAWLRPSLSVSTRLSVALVIKWNWQTLKFDYDAGMEFTGSLNAELSAGMKVKGTFEHKDDMKNWYIKRPTQFVIPIAGVPVPCIWWVKAAQTWEASISGEGEISGLYNGEVTFDVGAATSAMNKPPKEFNSAFTRSISGKLSEGEASLTYTFRPAVYVRCPSTPWFLEGETSAGVDESVPVRITDTIKIPVAPEFDIDISQRSELTTLEANLGFPIFFKISAKACSSECSDADKPLQQVVTAGLSSVQMVLSLAVVDFVFSWKPPETQVTKGFCAAQPIPCCVCDDTGEPGRLDPQTQKCLCKCECDTPNGKVKSVKPKNGDCKCDLCPADTLHRFYEDIKCPCTCPNGITKAMESDGTCDCSCDCADGSKDELDPSGECPCECECKNCQLSKKGDDGCLCPNDRCPVCVDGAMPEWVGCNCRCPDPECGIPPVCAIGRRGNNCKQPSCPSCQTCSGNGRCRPIPGTCASSCQCNPRWEGACCEIRIPRPAWGDPHLQTLDGVEFDYFGIGQFWDCVSEENDFGYQVRYFYYQQTSFTGAVAVKAGFSVLTITTRNPTSPLDKPLLRIDGNLKNLDKAEKLTLSNASVALDIRPVTGGTEDEKALVLISLEFKTGATLTLDVRYSPKIGRQYMNVLFKPTIPFLRKTSGICGIMDDDTSNDLTGPDQTLYNDTSDFVESWRILPMSRDQGGLYGSWSWSESNFHKDDHVDSSYTDPDYRPSYSMSGYSQQQIDLATTLCKSLGLEGNLLDGCIYDVVITNDTTFADQETLKIGCPRQCSGKGRCEEEKCVCLETWSGEDCSIGDCGLCYNGECESGFCKCSVGWDGVDCSQEATCHGVNNCTDSDHGVCDKHEKCLCHDGYTGEDCSQLATCYNKNNCSQNGVCVDFDVCKCNKAYKGNDCDQFSCELLDFCSNNGICLAKDVCLCNPGWTGPSCALPDCTDADSCSDHGICESPNQCSCYSGYTGNMCSEFSQCPDLLNCHQNGLCVSEQMTSDNATEKQICRCFDGFVGEFCESAVCDLVKNCTGHGRCVEPNLCQCEMGYTYDDCGEYSCEILKRCSGHGKCVDYDICSCDEGWNGPDCDIPDCAEENDCSGQGVCLSPHKCECFDGFEGNTCNETLGENSNPPMFNQSVYEVTISENEETGIKLVTVHATDDDWGKNGEIRYSFDPAGLSINVNFYLLVDGITGNIILLNPISRTLAPEGNINITLVARDGGVPSLSSEAIFRLYITEVNDHCPVFISPTPGEVLHINASYLEHDSLFTVSAIDDDYGRNGNVTYSLSNDIESSLFRIDPITGDVYPAVEYLLVGEYRLTFIASDQASTPCRTELSIKVQLVPSALLPVTTPEPITTMTSPRADVTTSEEQTTISSTDITTQYSKTQPPSTTQGEPYSTTISTRSSPKSTTDPGLVTGSTKTVSENITSSPSDAEDDGLFALQTTGVVLGVLLLVTVVVLVALALRLYSVQTHFKQQKTFNFKKLQTGGKENPTYE